MVTMKEQIRERIIEINYYLSQAMLLDDKVRVEALRSEMNKLINDYLNGRS